MTESGIRNFIAFHSKEFTVKTIDDPNGFMAKEPIRIGGNSISFVRVNDEIGQKNLYSFDEIIDLLNQKEE